MELDIAVESPWPGTANWEALAARAVDAAAAVAPELANRRLSASLLFTSDEAVQALNHAWRGKDKSTNVLSFPMVSRAQLFDLEAEGPPELLGDIALACETCMREAAQKGIAPEDHTAHLLIHGLLHLAGHDHETSPQEAARMEQLEIKALALLGIADPYCENH